MKELILKYRAGDGLSDQELKHLIAHYRDLVALLSAHGEVYHLVYVDALKAKYQLEDFQKAREQK